MLCNIKQVNKPYYREMHKLEKAQEKINQNFNGLCMLRLLRLLVTPWTAACQAPPSVGFSRQEPWRGLPFPSPGNPPDTGMETGPLLPPTLAGGLSATAPPGRPLKGCHLVTALINTTPTFHWLPRPHASVLSATTK